MPSIDFVPTVRYAGAVTIFFRDKHTVIVKQGSTMVIFHRWWERHDSTIAVHGSRFAKPCDVMLV